MCIVLDFYFNFKGSILGVLHSKRESTSWILPYQHFIATCLLPWGEINRPLCKFTGSKEISKATDDLTQAIHAFAHFMLIYMSGSLLLSDLQGKWLVTMYTTTFSELLIPSPGLFDAQHVMCLFDPQGQTYISTGFVDATGYSVNDVLTENMKANPIHIGMQAQLQSLVFWTSITPSVIVTGFAMLSISPLRRSLQ